MELLNRKQHRITLHPLGKQLLVNDQTPLIDALHEYGVEFPCGGKGTCGKCRVKLLAGEIEMSEVHRQKLRSLNLEPNWRLACYSRCTSDITLEIGQFDHLILADESDFRFTPSEGFGVAVDVGTTTLVAQLVDLSTGKVLAAETGLNPQVKFGADLISRIQAGVDGHTAEMAGLIRDAVGAMILKMLENHPVKLNRVVLVGNSAMRLFFGGHDVKPLSMYPFHIGHSAIQFYSPDELGWNFRVSEFIGFYPSMGSFVGSDILAGIAATAMHFRDEFTALIDLGTNGEIAIGNRQGIVCASTAAGPAFEGACISMGMRAVTGAISSLRLDNATMHAEVIGNTAPKGICGSALIDAVSILRQTGQIGMFGEILSGAESVPVAGQVILTQKDIYEFQLAKAAIAAGLEILTQNLGIAVGDISKLYIAGGFGNYINIDHLVTTGMTEIDREKIQRMGNTALIGAKMFLFMTPGSVNEILAITRHINLEGHPGFQDIYVEKMILG
ncbi:MAG: ASKHA domain-containing protein [Bacteroidota bacterium]